MEDGCPTDMTAYCDTLAVDIPCATCDAGTGSGSGTYQLQTDLINQRPVYKRFTANNEAFTLKMDQCLNKWTLTDTYYGEVYLEATTDACDPTSEGVFPTGVVVCDP